MPADSDKIRVAVRVRPLNDSEIARGDTQICQVDGNSVRLWNPKLGPADPTNEGRVFHFDKCFASDDPSKKDFADQRVVYDEIGRDVVESSCSGFNCCVFAYGQTGSGKTHTMLGDMTTDDGQGLTGRICKGLLSRIQEKREQGPESNNPSDPKVKESGSKSSSLRTLHNVHVSYYEVYLEKVRDLLQENQKECKPLRIREHPATGPFVDGLVSKNVSCYEEMEESLNMGDRHRTVAATNMNAHSSRSHGIYQISYTETTVDPSTLSAIDKTSKISLIDLAGSERADSSGSEGERLREASNINKSLTTLGRVIKILSSSQSGPVPYRDSTLTYLLKQSLGGNSRTTMIAMISPSVKNYEESLSTLRYAVSAKKVVNRAVVNEDPNSRIVRQLREEIADLRRELAKSKRNLRQSITESLTERKEILSEIEHIATDKGQTLDSTNLSDRVASLVNLNENLALSKGEALVYNLLPGITILGKNPPTSLQEWEARGDRSLSENMAEQPYHQVTLVADDLADGHVLVSCEDNKLRLVPVNSYPVSVNGIPIAKATFVRHRDRIKLGRQCSFRVYAPSEIDEACGTFADESAPEPEKNKLNLQIDTILEEKPAPEDKPIELSSSEILKLLEEANSLCEKLKFEYRLELAEAKTDEEDQDAPRIAVLLPGGQPSSVSWEPSTLLGRLQTLRNLATLQEESTVETKRRRPSRRSSLSSTLSALSEVQEEDPFFEVRSSAVRLVGHAKIYLDGLQNLQVELDFSALHEIPVFDGSGHQVANLRYQVVNRFTAIVENKTALVFSPRARNNLERLNVTLKLISLRFLSGFHSECIYLTYRRWNEEKAHATPQRMGTDASTFDLDHEIVLPMLYSMSNIKRVHDAHLCLDIWGRGDVEPVARVPELLELKLALRQYAINRQDHSASGATDTDIQAEEVPTASRRGRRRSSLNIAAKVDVFVSIDVEERGPNGLFQPVPVKDDGTLRLHQERPRRLIVHVTQADHQPFCLNQIQQVRMCLLGNIQVATAKDKSEVLGSSNFDANPVAEKKWIQMPLRRHDVDMYARSITSTLRWTACREGAEEENGTAFPELKCKNGERQVFRVALAFTTNKSTVPMVISKNIQIKMYAPSGRFKSKVQGAWWSRDSFSRSQRLGSWYSIEVAKQQGTLQSRGVPESKEQSADEELITHLLDIHGKGVERLDVVTVLDRTRQEILSDVEYYAGNELDYKAIGEDHTVVSIREEYFLRSPENSNIFIHLLHGWVFDTGESNDDDEIGEFERQSTAHLVTEPNNLDTISGGEMCGFLMVRNTSTAARFGVPGASSWIRRWFVLQRPFLYIYKSFAKKKEMGVIDISRCQLSVHTADNTAGVPFSFHLTDATHFWHLQASTAAELRAWLVAIDPLKIDARDAVINSSFETSAPTA